MLSFDRQNKFEKDYKRLLKQGKKIEKLDQTMSLLISEMPLGMEYRLHPLEPKNKVPKRWDIHIDGPYSDWVLIFYYDFSRNMIIFERTGSHSELFK